MLLFWWLLSQEDRRLPCSGRGEHRRASAGCPSRASCSILVWTAGLYTHYAFPLDHRALFRRCTRPGSWQAGGGAASASRIAALVALPRPDARVVRAVVGDRDPPADHVARARGRGRSGRPGHRHRDDPGVRRGARSQRSLPWARVLFVLALLGALPWPYFSRDGQSGGARASTGCVALLPLAWMLAPVVMIVALGLFRGAYLKFLLIGSPAFALLLARALGPAGCCWARRAGCAARVARGGRPPTETRREPGGRCTASRGSRGSSPSSPSSGRLQRASSSATATIRQRARDDYRGISQFIVATGQPNDAILLDAPGQSEVFGYYYKGDLPVVRRCPSSGRSIRQQTAAELDGAAGARQDLRGLLGDRRGRPAGRHRELAGPARVQDARPVARQRAAGRLRDARAPARRTKSSRTSNARLGDRNHADRIPRAGT